MANPRGRGGGGGGGGTLWAQKNPVNAYRCGLDKRGH